MSQKPKSNLLLVILTFYTFYILATTMCTYFLDRFTFTQKQIPIEYEKITKVDTICSVLNGKNLLSDKEYEFEAIEVASLYDHITFLGYIFIVSPIIYLLKKSSFLDGFYLIYCA